MKQRCIPVKAVVKRRRFAYEDLSGPGVAAHPATGVCGFGKLELRNLADISASHIYNLRDSKTYASVRVHMTHTQARRVSSAVRICRRGHRPAGQAQAPLPGERLPH